MLIRNEQVIGSNPIIGSIILASKAFIVNNLRMLHFFALSTGVI